MVTRKRPQRWSPRELHLSRLGLEFIAGWEGFRGHPYKPIKGEIHWTWGYGHYGPDVPTPSQGRTISREQALRLLRKDAREREAVVRRLVDVPLTQGEYEALVSLVFNIGEGNFASSSVLRLLNRGHRGLARRAFSLWVRGSGSGGVLVRMLGLVRRRAAERLLFRRGHKRSRRKASQPKQAA